MIIKYSIFIVIITAVSIRNGFSEWRKLESDLDSLTGIADFSMLTFVSSEIGWAQGGKKGEEIFRTENKGMNWKRMPLKGLFNENQFGTQSVSFVNEDHVWVLWKDTLYITTNGGENWGVINLTVTGLRRISFQSLKKGVACTQSAMFYTDDGGKTWQNSIMPDAWDGVTVITDLKFTGSLSGWASAWGPGFDVGTILHTNDGGETWKILKWGAEYDGVWGIDSMHVIAVGTDGRYRCGIIDVTFDGGKTWYDTLIPEPNSYKFLDDVAFINAEFGVAVSTQGLLFETYDGGRTWRKIEDIGDKASNNVSAFGNALFILLTNGEIYYYELASAAALRHIRVEKRYTRTEYHQLLIVNTQSKIGESDSFDLSGRKAGIRQKISSGILIMPTNKLAKKYNN